MTGIPQATYRLQLRAEFGFDDAATVVPYLYGLGISHEGCLLDLALEHDLVQKSGSFFSYGELRLGQGRNNTKQYLHENGDLAGEIEVKLFEQLGIERKPAAPRAVPDAEDAEGAETGEGAEQAAEAAAEPERKAA